MFLLSEYIEYQYSASQWDQNLRIFNCCEVRIDNSVTRVTVWHHEACRVMPNSYHEWQKFQFAPNNHYRIFFLHTFRRLYLSLNMCYFINFALKLVHFQSRNVRFGSYLRHPQVMHEVVLHPLVWRKYPEQVKITENLVGHAIKKSSLGVENGSIKNKNPVEQKEVGWLCWGLTSQSTIFQSCQDGAIASWVINQYFRGVTCLAQGHNTAEVGLEPRTSRSGVRHSTTEPPRSPTKGGYLVIVPG